MRVGHLLLVATALAAPACGRRAVEVDHPFYLMFIEDPAEVALFRCPDRPGVGCAIDGLPGPFVEAAGANEQFIVVAQRPNRGGGPTRYYYFARVREERRGWGNHPEQIVGPLGGEEFEAAKARLGLPDFTVRP
ncbi:MAG TPA: hypothetical protein VF702_08635 [Allosphingosinicella sp.]|jgi:hypothetical protein